MQQLHAVNMLLTCRPHITENHRYRGITGMLAIDHGMLTDVVYRLMGIDMLSINRLCN